MTYFYDPEKWLETTIRALQAYVADAVKNSVLDDVGNPVGDQVYDVVMEFPSPASDRFRIPLSKAVIHFELDANDNPTLGFGDNFFNDNYDAIAQTVNPQEGRQHQLNFDVGIWASDRTGGTTIRMRAAEILDQLFHGSIAQRSIQAFTDGGNGRLEILRWTGGRFLTDSINDSPVYRMIGGELELRVFSRTPLVPAEAIPSIETIDQAPGLTIIP